MDPHDVASPDPSEIAPHAIAFARMMFAHAAFEREVRSLVDAINPKKLGFGERPENQWTASESNNLRQAAATMVSDQAHGAVSIVGP
jgi:hypothetical protein